MTFYTPRRKRARTYRKKSGVYATPAGFSPAGAGNTRRSLMAAAEIFAATARAKAAKFSTRIPAATSAVPLGEQEAMVWTDGHAAPNAAPFEFGERHPVFGNRKVWRPQPRRAYMNRTALDAGANAAALEIYGQMETEMLAEEFGFNQ